MTGNYHMGLLYMVHLLISSDGHIDNQELEALQRVKSRENIPDELFNRFEADIQTKKPHDIYEEAIEQLNQCSEEEKLRAFVILYKMSEVDGRVHVKEVRLLLYSIKGAKIDFDEVARQAEKLPAY
jgi:hypothetical protein